MSRFGRDFRGGERQQRRPEAPRRSEDRESRLREEEIAPRPVNGKCSNLCPLFWCTKRAYQIRRDPKTGRKFVFCSWIGDECIGASCQYATCKSNYLLPDGSCGYVKQKSQASSEEKEIFEDLIKEDIDSKVKDVISKKLGKKKLDDLL